MSLAQVLPFLAALKKSTPDFSGMTADQPSLQDQASQAQQVQQAPTPAPDMSIGAPQMPPPPPPNPEGDIAQSIVQGQQAPKLAPETKGHALLRLLQGGLVGGLSGLSANAQTYAQTGRNAGFGGGAAAGYTQALPMQAAFQQLGLQKAGLENQQLIQMLPFLRAQQIAGLQKTQAETGKETALGQKAQAETQAIPAETALKNAQAFAANYKEQNGILYNLQTGKPLTPDASGMVQTPADIAGALGVAPGTKLPSKQITDARSAYYGHLNGADPAIIAQIGPPPMNDRAALVQWGKQAEAIKTRMSAAPRLEMTMARPVQVADPNNPGNITYMPAGQAMQQGAMAPSSAAPAAAKAITKSAVAGPIANEINANNTAIAHADLLLKAAKALGNGDEQTLSGLKNSFANEFGSSGPVTAQAIADAYTREVTKMLSAGHMTDSEIGTVGKTLNPNKQNMAQIQGVISAYKALAASKLQQRQNQVTQGLQGKPNFPQESQFTVTDPAGGIHTFKDQKSADGFKAAVGIK